jgi:DNA-binding NarL/FixJ family response regulator
MSEEAVAEPNPDARRSLGTIWIDCPHQLLSGKLGRALRTAATTIHRGPEPPRQLPSAVVCYADGAADVAGRAGTILASCPGTTLLVLGPSADPSLARAALRAGARGFVHAGMGPGQIARALRVAVEGELVLPRALLEGLAAGDRRSDLSVLRPRQREVLDLVAEGLTNAEIARRLYVAESTVKQHLRSAYKALGVNNRRQASGVLRRNA